MADLLMVCPSRSRPKAIAELAEAWRATSTGTASLLVAVDDDDPELEAYQALAAADLPIVAGPRLRIGGTLNALMPRLAEDYFALGFLGDDHRPRTQGWDQRFVDELRRLGTGLVYGDDLLQGANLPTAVAMTSDIVRALGYFVPPGALHMYFDNYWKGLGQSIDRLSYLPEVVIEHMHPVAGKAEWDAQYQEVNAESMYARDRATFAAWVQRDSEEAVGRLKALVEAG